ncbi:Uncharacterised protein [Porphyromonas macacae]|uniref:N-acetyltransferase domain-containing protein n=1 Tax=Porphyromonas macacae TaxID=28115 RepID=A0A379E7S2_9PORP|nr:GNAT family N-acetyltransferase [Porphyromonas macacae]SUB88480.1 Uncharacterised protein [Porphyromonas macacae]
MIEIIHTEKEGKGLFKAMEGTREAGKMSYYIRQGKGEIVIDHTEVDNAFTGRGVGRKLVGEAVVFARKRGMKIDPQCSFARHILEKEQVFEDVL